MVREQTREAARQKARKSAAPTGEEEDWEEEDEVDEDLLNMDWLDEEPQTKKARKQVRDSEVPDEATGPGTGRREKVPVVPLPQQLEPGAVVLYWDVWRGVVHDAFEALDSFWVADEESGQVVRDESGEIVAFKSAELQLVAPPPKAPEGNPYAPVSGVLILGTSLQMMRVLEHFGPPDPAKRTEPQELLAIPCALCDPGSLLRTARDGVNASTTKLAQEQRPDLHVALRVYHLKQAVEQCPALLRLEDYFCLAGVTVPFSTSEIKAGRDKEEKRWRKTVANQLDVGVTAYGARDAGTDTPLLEVAQQALGQSCGMCLSDVLWQAAAQSGIRQAMHADELPLHFADSMGARVYVILLPEDAQIIDEGGILSFHESLNAEYATIGMEAVVDGGTTKDAGGAAATPGNNAEPGKTVSQWEAEQDKFADQPKLPPGWIRIQSRTTGKVYFYNKETQESSFEAPLPEGWTQQVSKSTGKTYYFNARKNKSTFVRPFE